jgi:hypothetical protein
MRGLMRFRSIAIRLVLIIAALATVATSPPASYMLSASDTIELSGPVTVRVFARANAPAFEHADRFVLELAIESAEPGQTLTLPLIPDDPSQPIIEAELVNGFLLHWVELASDDPCPRESDAGCELGMSIELPEGATVTVQATGWITAQGDPSFFFPENRDFPADAVIEVGFDE